MSEFNAGKNNSFFALLMHFLERASATERISLSSKFLTIFLYLHVDFYSRDYELYRTVRKVNFPEVNRRRVQPHYSPCVCIVHARVCGNELRVTYPRHS